jgi:hypothetical protein
MAAALVNTVDVVAKIYSPLAAVVTNDKIG